MRQKPAPRETFFSLKSEAHNARPTSVATEFVDTDFDDDIISEAEDNSPRVSLQSVSKETKKGKAWFSKSRRVYQTWLLNSF